jgi:hypothetical protein
VRSRPARKSQIKRGARQPGANRQTARSERRGPKWARVRATARRDKSECRSILHSGWCAATGVGSSRRRQSDTRAARSCSATTNAPQSQAESHFHLSKLAGCCSCGRFSLLLLRHEPGAQMGRAIGARPPAAGRPPKASGRGPNENKTARESGGAHTHALVPIAKWWLHRGRGGRVL